MVAVCGVWCVCCGCGCGMCVGMDGVNGQWRVRELKRQEEGFFEKKRKHTHTHTTTETNVVDQQTCSHNEQTNKQTKQTQPTTNKRMNARMKQRKRERDKGTERAMHPHTHTTLVAHCAVSCCVFSHTNVVSCVGRS